MIKLLAEETYSHAFAAFYDAHADAEWVSSALLRIEVTRAVARAMPALLPDARDLLLAFSSIAIDDDIVEGAMNEPDRALRSLHAIEGMRIIAVHAYHRIDCEEVWVTLRDDVPRMDEAIKRWRQTQD